MRIMLKPRRRASIRAGLATVALSALLATSALTPAVAAEGSPSSPTVAVSESNHHQAARNVRVSVEGTNITVTWDGAQGVSSYLVKLFNVNEGAIKIAKRHSNSVTFTAPQVAVGQAYRIIIVAESGDWDIPASKVESTPFIVPDPANAGGGEPAAPGSDSGQNQPGGPGTQTEPPQNQTPLEGSPSAPQGVIPEILSSSSLRVSFLPPKSAGTSPINAYVVKLTPQDGGQAIEKTLSTPKELSDKSTVFPNLTPGTTYKVQVAAKNQSGTGAAQVSTPESVTLSEDPTAQLAVSAPVTLDKLDPSKPNTLSVVGTGYTGEAAKTYGVDVVVADTNAWTPGTFPVNEFTKTIHISPDQINASGAFNTELTIDVKADNLTLGNNYFVGTVAANGAKYYERRLDKQAAFDFLPLTPKNVSLTKTGDKSVRIGWDLLTEDPRVSSYRVTLNKVRDGSEEYVNHFEVGRAVNFKEFFNLKDGVYVGNVVAEVKLSNDPSVLPARSTAVKTGQVTISTASTAPQTNVPAAPGTLNLRLAVKDSRALEASWFEPNPSNGKILNYEIELIGNDGSTRKLNADMTSDIPEFMKISGVTNGVSYTFKVRAQNADGWSNWSAASNAVTIPANQDEFAMTPPSELFATVDKDTAKVTIQWINSGYEPKNGQWIVRVSCVESCPSGFKSFVLDAPTSQDFVVSENMKPGIYKASLKLVNGAVSSRVIESDIFVVGTPAVVPNPKITVTPTTDIDPTVENVFTVSGTGYVGSMAENGVYIVAADPSVWTPGTVPTFSETNRFAASVHVAPSKLNAGTFTATLVVPSGSFDPTKTYVIGTMAAHGLSIAPQRTLDAGQKISFVTNNDNPPTATPPLVSVKALKDAQPTATFVAGQANTIDLEFTNAREGSQWNIALHSDPIELGTVTVNAGKSVLSIPADLAARFTEGDHTLVFTPVANQDGAAIRLPWRVLPKAVQPADPPKPGNDTKPADPPKPGDPHKPIEPPQTGDNTKPGDAPKQGDDSKATDQQKPADTSKKSDAPTSKAAHTQLAKTGSATAPLSAAGALLMVAGLAALRSRQRH